MRGLTASVAAWSAWGAVAMGATPALVVEALLPATPAEAYRAWTTAEGFREAVGRPLRVELRPGGAYEVEWSDEAPAGMRGSEGCETLSFVPDRMVSFTWNAPPHFGPLRDERTFVVVLVEPAGPDASRVTLWHQGFGEGGRWEELRAYFAAAWPTVLEEMRASFERRRERAAP